MKRSFFPVWLFFSQVYIFSSMHSWTVRALYKPVFGRMFILLYNECHLLKIFMCKNRKFCLQMLFNTQDDYKWYLLFLKYILKTHTLHISPRNSLLWRPPFEPSYRPHSLESWSLILLFSHMCWCFLYGISYWLAVSEKYLLHCFLTAL